MDDQDKLDDVRLDIQAVNIAIDDDFRGRIRGALGRLRRYYSGHVITAEVYLREEAHPGPNQKSLRIKYGVPGDDVFAEESGESWDHLLNSVTAKVKHQLDRRFGNSQNRYRQHQ